MGYSFGGPIVTDGLVASYDAADKNSYPGSGTNWSDLVGSNTAVLTNGPTFSNLNRGSITVDGSNDSIEISSGSGDFSFTSEMFMEVMVVPKDKLVSNAASLFLYRVFKNFTLDQNVLKYNLFTPIR